MTSTSPHQLRPTCSPISTTHSGSWRGKSTRPPSLHSTSSTTKLNVQPEIQTCSCGRRYRIQSNLEVCELSHCVIAETKRIPSCEGFTWLGQPFYACETCGEPAWEHDKMQAPYDSKSGPFSKRPFQFDTLSHEMKQSIRRRWEPAMIRAGYVPPSRRL